MSLLVSGDRVTDTLVIDRLLGEGAFAEVYRVRHEYLGAQAMKVFKRLDSLEKTRELLGEAQLLSTLGHPNIVRLFDANIAQTAAGLRGFFTMEYVAGGSLERLTKAHQSQVPVDLVVEIIEQIAEGLAVAHAQLPPIVHRDLTLANILIGYDGIGMRVRISDFGLAKQTDPFSQMASAQGTYAFMAPEVLRGGKGYSCASDIWSIGTIAFLLLTNHIPYHDGGPFSSFSMARFKRDLLPPSAYNPDVDPHLDEILLATLAVDPKGRPATGRALADALRKRHAAIEAQPRAVPVPEKTATDRPTARAQSLADEAFALARQPGALERAADLLEEAVNLSPNLRDRHLPTLTLWRRGVIM